MKEVVHRRKTCRTCNGTDLDLALHLEPTPVGDAYLVQGREEETKDTYSLDLYLCRSCGLAQLLDVVDPEILYGEFIYETSISLGLVDHFGNYASKVLDRVDIPEGSFVIDVGSNDGTLLKFFKARGMRVLGMDPARDIAQKATDSGIETLPVFFNSELSQKIKEERGPANIVTTNNTFANIDDLDDMVEGLSHLLASDGVLVIETGYGIDLAQKGLFDNIYHEHLSYFGITPLVACLQRHGLSVIDVERVPTKGGSIRVYAQLAEGPHKPSQTFSDILAEEEQQGIKDVAPYEALTKKLMSAKQELANLLDDILQQGKTVAGYGASVGVTTFLYHFDLGQKLAYLVDDNPAKHGLYSPGYHLPVQSSDVLYEQKPDYVLILAWRYADAIIDKHRAFVEHGGKFILPWSDLQVVGD